MQRMRLRNGIQPEGWCDRIPPPRRQLETGSHNLILPLRSYRYDMARPLVRVGQIVRCGEALSEASGLLSRVRLAPASGEVLAVENRVLASGCRVPCVVLRVQTPDESPLDPELALSAQGLENSEGLPLDYELGLLPEDPVLLINAAETEQGQWALQSLLEEQANSPQVRQALKLLCDKVNFSHAWLSFHCGEEELALQLVDLLKDVIPLTPLKLDDTFPSAHPRLLARRLAKLNPDCRATDPERPLAAQGLLCLNLDRLQLLQRRLMLGCADRFLISWLKADGTAELLELPSGLPLQALKGIPENHEVFLGSAMNGERAGSTEMPLLPPLRALVSMAPTDIPEIIEDACITCGRCLEVCPQGLAPPRLAHLIEEQRLDEARQMGLAHCLNCGVCSYVCPSRIHLGHSLKKGRWLLVEGRND